MRILIVDEQPLFREALGLHLEAIYPEATVFEANTVAEAQGVLAMYAVCTDYPRCVCTGAEGA